MNNLALNCIKEQRALGTDFFLTLYLKKITWMNFFLTLAPQLAVSR